MLPTNAGKSVTPSPGWRGGAAAVALCEFAALQGASRVASAGELRIEVAREGEFVSVRASAQVNADLPTAWEVLTDYDHLAEFIPDMRSSRVVRRDGGSVLVEQKGEFGFFFFRQAIDVVLSVSEQPPRRIVARTVEGNLKDMEASYELKASTNGLRLDYTGRFVPDFFLPPLIGMPLVRRSLERRLQSMVNEIERRYAVARGRPAPQREGAR
ncbi:MAG: SRPBCC family protein [Burkholderiales bacterium]